MKYSIMKKAEQIQRITEMENNMNIVSDAVRSLTAAIEKYLSVQVNIKELENYYASPQWKEDFTADENREIPCEIKRGVLSEDGIYNLLCENQELIESIKKSF